MTSNSGYPSNWIRAIQRIRKLDLSFTEKYARLTASHKRFQLSWDSFEYGLLKISEDFRPCEDCGELLPCDLWHFEYLGHGKHSSVCRQCESAIRTKTIEEQRKANLSFRLTDIQWEFITKHNVSFDRVFFANGMKHRQFRVAMKAGGYEVAVGVAECERAGHSMRNRSNHCVQCAPYSLTCQRRHETAAYIYIAVSDSSSLVKVGLTNDLKTRGYMLNQSSYGGHSDWKMAESVFCHEAGKVEAEVHRSLSSYKYCASYIKQGARVDCRELFVCNVEIALQALHTAANCS